MAEIEFVNRYDLLEMPQPDIKAMCQGQCEGTGMVPVFRNEGKINVEGARVPDAENDAEGPWRDLWDEAEAKSPSGDGWQFVKCPSCRGIRKRQ